VRWVAVGCGQEERGSRENIENRASASLLII
jgi:hypothetical protein